MENTKQNPMLPMAVLDLEGVLIPEIWHALAEVAGEADFKATTREISNYDELMRMRIHALDRHNITLTDIQKVIRERITPLEGAVDFLRSLRSEMEVIILSDTFVDFFEVIRPSLEYPTIFCNLLNVQDGIIKNHIMRLPHGKCTAVQAFKDLNFVVVAAGDSYNDIEMLKESHYGVFFKPAKAVTEEYVDIPVANNYKKLKMMFDDFLANSV